MIPVKYPILQPQFKPYKTRQLIADLARFVRPYKWRFWLGTFCRIAGDILRLYIPFALSQLVTFATKANGNSDLSYFWKIIISMVVCAILQYSFMEGAKLLIYPVAEKSAIDAMIASIKHIFLLDSVYHEKENSGNKMKRIDRGGDSINKILRMYVDLLIESTINLIAITIVFQTLSFELNLMFLAFFTTYYCLALFLTRIAIDQQYRANQQEEEFDGVAFESINNIMTVKSLGIGSKILPYLTQKGDLLMNEIRKRVIAFRTRAGFLNIYKEIFRVVIVAYTIIQIIHGRFDIGIIALVIMYFNNIEAAAREFSDFYNDFITAKIGVDRMMDILNEKPLIELLGDQNFKSDWQKLQLKNVSFSYKGRTVLENLDLEIRRGEKVGIVGISGTGKSTLFKLLLKLYNNYEGEIAFDNLPLRTIKRDSYLEKIAVVPQETELFNMSVQDNIALSFEGPNLQRLQKALAIAHIEDFTHKLKNGLDTFVGEKGMKLSGGERQRIGIARAVYKQPEIIFMDEATSHLDADSEKKIQAALHDFFQNITAIVIAHRLSTLREMDRIVVIKKGRIIEQGTFNELIAQNGEFTHLWERQKL